MELNLPHKPPILFAKKILSHDELHAKVELLFETTPSLAMLIEAAAQSTAAFNNTTDVKSGYLVSMKNIKLCNSPSLKKLEVSLHHLHSLGNMKIIDFQVNEDIQIIATGSLTIAIEENNNAK